MKLFFTLIMIIILSSISFPAEAVVTYDLKDLRDPFESLLPKEASKADNKDALPPLIVKGLIWGSNKPQAIVNDSVVKIGDEVAGTKIVDINKDYITVLFNNRLYELHLKKEIK